MKILIAGFGSIGRRHFRNLRTLGVEDLLFYRTQQSTLPVEEIQGYVVEHDLEKALAHDPDAVIVANPTASHLDVAIPAAEAGCHLLLEKPISHNLDRVDALRRALERNQKKALVGYQFRFHPVLRQVKAMLDHGEIGRPLSFRAEWGEYLPNWHPWEDYRKSYSARRDMGGGVVLTLSHPLDYLRWFFGPVEKLWAFVDQVSDLELEVDDYAEIGLRYHQGVSGSLCVNYFQRPPIHQIEIICTNGKIGWNNDTGAAQVYLAEENVSRIISPHAGFERNELFLSETRHFLDVIHGKAKPVCTLEDGKAALSLALAAIESSINGNQVKMSSFDAPS